MARKGITGADVVRAYVELQREGRAPSLLNLRLQLGRGSYSTIARHLRTFAFAQLPAAARRPRREGAQAQGAASPGASAAIAPDDSRTAA